MGKLTQFEILLDNPEAVYNDGQLLRGKVVVQVIESLKITGIDLVFKGDGYVLWSETTHGGKRQRVYDASETYIDQKLVIIGKDSEENGSSIILQAGRHIYPFEYQLPKHIPSSIKAKYGQVRYRVTGRFKEPWKRDVTVKRPFTIVNEVNLNTSQEAMYATSGEGSKNVCCCCWKSGPISCMFQLERSGYVPGESIPVRGEVTNHSDRMIRRSYAELLMIITYFGKNFARFGYKRSTQKVAEISRGPIRPGDSDIWNGDLLPVPRLPPSRLLGCAMMTISYCVNLRVEPKRPSSSLEVPVDIVIGSIPLQRTQQLGPGPSAPNQHAAENSQQQSNSTHMAPPSYDSLVLRVVNNHLHSPSSRENRFDRRKRVKEVIPYL